MVHEYNENKGITLIALIITVIILLILAGTAISISINGNDLFGKAQTAREEWNASVETEQTKLDEIISILKEASGPDPIAIPTSLSIGDTVNWTPSGHYEWNEEYYSEAITTTRQLYSGDQVPNGATTTWQNGNNVVTNIDMTISSWKVLNIDSANHKVTLVPAQPTEAQINLHGSQGYNNGVKLLNDACSALYGDKIGIEARSISMVDLEGTAGDGSNGLMSADLNKIVSAKNSGFPSYGQTNTNNNGSESVRNPDGSYIATGSKYPLIYEEEALRNINSVYSAVGIGMSESSRNGFISRDNSKVNGTSIRPTKTTYTLNHQDFAAALGYPSDTKTGLLLPNGENTRNYWIASRFINLFYDGCHFSIRCTYNGALSGYCMSGSSGSPANGNCSLFPIVTLSNGTINGSNNTYTYTPAM